MLQCWRRTGHLPSFFVPTPGDWQLKSPHPREFAILGQKNANARGGGGMGAGGIDWCISQRYIFLLTAPAQYMYTCIEWAPPKREWVPCRQAFLFSLVNPSGLGPTKMSLINGREQFAIISYHDCGPVFGRGHDLCVLKQDTYPGGSTLGGTYQCPPGQQKEFFTGRSDFTITDVEVFGLHRW